MLCIFPWIGTVSFSVLKTEAVSFSETIIQGVHTRYSTRYFFNNFTTNEDIAKKFEGDLTARNIQLRIERHPTLHTPAWPKFSPFSATASFRRDFGHRARPI